MWSDLAENIDRHLLQSDHPFYPALERIFASSKTLDSEKNLRRAGFKILQVREPMFIIALHPALPGHLFKVHLHSSSRSIKTIWKNLISRCNSAERLRDLIQEKNISRFVVPNKWIYTTPTEKQDPVLIVTYMNIVSEEKTKYAWKNFASKNVLKELYWIIRHDCGSSKLVENVPYTKDGVFACIDTEKPTNGDDDLKKYLSPEGRMYWDSLVVRYEK